MMMTSFIYLFSFCYSQTSQDATSKGKVHYLAFCAINNKKVTVVAIFTLETDEFNLNSRVLNIIVYK